LGLFFPIYGKIKNVPNHQPDEIIPSKVVLTTHHHEILGNIMGNYEIYNYNTN
jgi:hypothetical protein